MTLPQIILLIHGAGHRATLMVNPPMSGNHDGMLSKRIRKLDVIQLKMTLKAVCVRVCVHVSGQQCTYTCVHKTPDISSVQLTVCNIVRSTHCCTSLSQLCTRTHTHISDEPSLGLICFLYPLHLVVSNSATDWPESRPIAPAMRVERGIHSAVPSISFWGFKCN